MNVSTVSRVISFTAVTQSLPRAKTSIWRALSPWARMVFGLVLPAEGCAPSSR